MKYSNYIDLSVVDGEGTRCVLFVSGCEHKCKGCYNKSTWSTNNGQDFTPEVADQIIRDLNDSRIKRRGITLSGGDPLHKANLAGIYYLVSRIKEECPDKDIWLYTGFVYEDLLAEYDHMRINILRKVDILVDGKFEQHLHVPGLPFKGSTNQRIIKIDLPNY